MRMMIIAIMVLISSERSSLRYNAPTLHRATILTPNHYYIINAIQGSPNARSSRKKNLTNSKKQIDNENENIYDGWKDMCAKVCRLSCSNTAVAGTTLCLQWLHCKMHYMIHYKSMIQCQRSPTSLGRSNAMFAMMILAIKIFNWVNNLVEPDKVRVGACDWKRENRPKRSKVVKKSDVLIKNIQPHRAWQGAGGSKRPSQWSHVEASAKQSITTRIGKRKVVQRDQKW